MPNKGGIITRKELIEDEALRWGEVYAKQLDLAIEKNKEFVKGILELAKASKSIKETSSQIEYIREKEKIIKINEKQNGIYKEQRQLEDSLITTMRKRELASESTNRALVREQAELALLNKQIKKEELERLGLVTAYNKLNNARTEAKNKLRDLIASEQASIEEIKKAKKEFDEINSKVKKADEAVGDFAKNVGNYQSAFDGIKDIFAAFGIAGGLSALSTIATSVYNTTKELESLDLALKSVTGSQDEFAKQQAFLTEISGKYGLEIKNLTTQYTAFYVAAKDKLAAQEIQDLFENISKTGSALGLSNEMLERSFAAVNQMLSKGTVASEELRGQLAEAMPGAVQAMTKAVQILHPEIKNLTEKGLFEMIKNGKILASEVLPETARQLVKVVGADKAESVDTLTKSTNRLSNSWVSFVRGLNEIDTGPITSFFNFFVKGAGNALDALTRFNASWDRLYDQAKSEGKALGSKEFDRRMASVGFLTSTDKERALGVLKTAQEEYNILVQKQKKNNEDLAKSSKQGLVSGLLGGYDREAELKKEKEQIELDIAARIEIKRRAEEKLYGKSNSKKTTSTISEKDNKQADKYAKERLDYEKRLSDSLYDLEKQRLEREISLNDEIIKDDEQTDAIRIEIALKNQQKQFDLALLAKNHLLDNDKLTANDKIRIEEEYQNKKIDISKKTALEIDKINEFDEVKFNQDLEKKLSESNIGLNTELESENRRFQSLGDLEKLSQSEREKAIKEHEQKIFDIKKKFAIEALKLQITNLDNELKASDVLPENERLSAEKRQKIAETLTKKKLDLSEVELSTNEQKGNKLVETEKEFSNKIKEISGELYGALKDLTNSLFEARIANIDNEINKNNEYYAKQIELAGNDVAQKEALQKEQKKKNDELEQKKKEEQKKQAIANRVMALADIGIKTAQAIMAANVTIQTMNAATLGIAGTAYGAWAIPAIYTIAGIQAAAILASPLPKYKYGRKGGKEEMAIVGDGGVSEVIQRASGGIELTPAKDTLVKLNQGDSVYSSVEDYINLQRQSLINSINYKGEELAAFQAQLHFENRISNEFLNELKENTRAIKNQKTTTIVNVPKIDFAHEFWKMKNTNWH